jgi:hypothetical protein|tara:strand:+ start:764 stop:994 length:231 start_codon:yes stop_codon:yes gene_type:complete
VADNLVSDELLTKLIASSARIEERVENVREDVAELKKTVGDLKQDVSSGRIKLAGMTGALAVLVSAGTAWIVRSLP